MWFGNCMKSHTQRAYSICPPWSASDTPFQWRSVAGPLVALWFVIAYIVGPPWSASDTPFQWRSVGGPLVALCCVIAYVGGPLVALCCVIAYIVGPVAFSMAHRCRAVGGPLLSASWVCWNATDLSVFVLNSGKNFFLIRDLSSLSHLESGKMVEL